tara:strand:+ start:3519 stop:3638 length:120 start_codon:yes stop_codon:yes gene_type:complete
VLDYNLDHTHEDAKALFNATLVDKVDENGEFERDKKGFI